MAQEEQPSESTPGPLLVPSSGPAPAPGPHIGFAPTDAEMELPKGLVSIVLDLSGTSTREFSDSQNRFIAAVAKVTTPAKITTHPGIIPVESDQEQYVIIKSSEGNVL
jgi:hypothetical protein